MHSSENFQTLATIDLSVPEVWEFRKSLLEIDWMNPSNTYVSAKKLSYAPGFSFHDINFCNNHPEYQKALSLINRDQIEMPECVIRARKLSKPFFDYIERLIPNTYIVKSEIIFNPPEEINKQAELDRMHIDLRNLHIHSKRCQLGIMANSDSFLFVENECCNTYVDRIITFNNRKTHWGVNWGNTNKLTLIFDLLNHDTWHGLSSMEQQCFYAISEPDQDDLRHTEFCIEFAKKYNLHFDVNRPRIN